MIYTLGATQQSIDFLLTDDTGLPVLGRVAATMPVIFWTLAGPAIENTITLSDLAAVTSPWSAGGLKEKGEGYYRLDLPNAAFSVSGIVTVGGEASGLHVFAERLWVGVFLGLQVSASVTYAGAVNPLTNDVTLIRGDDYLVADNRQLLFTNAAGTWPNLTAGSVVFEYKDGDGKLFSSPMTINTPVGPNQQLQIAFTAAQTGSLSKQNYTFSAIATLSDGSVVTLFKGSMTVLPQI